MDMIIKKEDLNDEIFNFLIDESFDLCCKVKSIDDNNKEIMKLIKQKLKNIYLIELSDNKIYTAYYNDELVGVSCINNENHVSDLFVRKEYQNNGIGSMLLKQVIDDNNQYGDITLNANKKYLKFYLENHFKIINETEDSIRMKI